VPEAPRALSAHPPPDDGPGVAPPPPAPAEPEAPSTALDAPAVVDAACDPPGVDPPRVDPLADEALALPSGDAFPPASGAPRIEMSAQ
jgi:hypothetical protein